MKLDKEKQYIFKKELLQKHWNKPIDKWADIINTRVVQVIEDGNKAKWEGDVIYTVGVDQVNRPIKQKVHEVFFMEPEWCEEVKEVEQNTDNNV